MNEHPDIPRLTPNHRPAPRPTSRPAPVMPSACASNGCGGPETPPREPPPVYGEVRVNGVEIAPDDIAREMQHHPAPDQDGAWHAAARALAIRELLLQEARRCGIPANPETDEAGREEAEADALIRQLLDEAVTPVMPGEAECRRYYDAQRHRFRTPDLFEAAHVLIEPESDDEEGWTMAEDQARTIIVEVGDDPAAFAAVAREMSACASAKQDGSLGQVRRGELLPAVQAAIEATPEGTTRREPVRSTHGWHVIRLHRKIDGHTLPFEAVRPKIAEMFGARGWSIAATRYVTALAAGAEVGGVIIGPSPDPAAL